MVVDGTSEFGDSLLKQDPEQACLEQAPVQKNRSVLPKISKSYNKIYVLLISNTRLSTEGIVWIVTSGWSTSTIW